MLKPLTAFITATALAVFCAPPAHAVTVEELVAEAVRANPRVEAARIEWERAGTRPARARAYDDPMLTWTEPVREVETRLGPAERTIGLSQRIPFPGKLSLKGDIAGRDAEIARLRYEKTLRDLVAEVRKAAFDLHFVDSALELERENEAVLEYFAEISSVNYGLDVSELDELVRARKSSAKAALKLMNLREMRESVVARLNTLLDRSPDSGIESVEVDEDVEPGAGLTELYSRAEEYNEEIRIAGLRAEKSELERELSGYAWRPDFRLGVSYTFIGELDPGPPDTGEDAVAVTLGMTIPLWFSRNRAEVAEGRLGAEKGGLERRAVTTEIRNMVRRAYFDMTTARGIMEAYGERFIPQAEESVEFAEARYETGREKLGRLLEVQSMRIDFRLTYQKALADYLKAAAELDRLTGGGFSAREGGASGASEGSATEGEDGKEE